MHLADAYMRLDSFGENGEADTSDPYISKCRPMVGVFMRADSVGTLGKLSEDRFWQEIPQLSRFHPIGCCPHP